MKKTICIEKPLPAFKINIPELAILYRKISACFEQPDDVNIQLDVEISNSSLTFTNLDEFRNCEELPDTITKFSLYISSPHTDQRAYIERRIGSGNLGVRAYGESEAWPAGVAETILATVAAHGTWYRWINRVPRLILFSLMEIGVIVPWALSKPFSAEGSPISLGRISVSLLFFALLLMISVFRSRAFPGSVIVVRETEGWIRKNGATLTFIITLLGLLANLMEWILRR